MIKKHDYSDYGDMKSRSGFTLIEAMLGMMVLLTAASFIAPAFTRDLILGQVMWERRLAVRVIETQLDQACNTVQTNADFNNLDNVAPTAIANPPELAAANATWEQSVALVNGDPDLKRVIVTVQWNSRRAFEESSAPYDISRIGICGAGT